MSKINILSSKIYNRIAAGEVIERPASVVKELVENSIDSGAKNISVEISRGGISSIKISDDGCGIEKTELKKAICEKNSIDLPGGGKNGARTGSSEAFFCIGPGDLCSHCRGYGDCHHPMPVSAQAGHVQAAPGRKNHYYG